MHRKHSLRYQQFYWRQSRPDDLKLGRMLYLHNYQHSHLLCIER